MAETQARSLSPKTHTTRTTCRACASPNLTPVLDLGNQYLVNFTREKNSLLPRAPLDLVQCQCGLLQLRDTVNPDVLFREFWYRTGMNDTMRAAMRDLVSDGLRYAQDGIWVDIGANDGYLLAQVPSDFKKVAFEPALNFASDIEEHADVAISDYFTGDHEILHRADGGACDVITSAAMFYDLDDPHRFVAAIADALTPKGVWINQLNDSPTMLRKNAWDAICHEHLCYYDLPTLSAIYQQHGLKIVNISYNEVNGGSVRVTASKHGTQIPLLGHRSIDADDCQQFAERTRKWRQTMSWVMDSLRLAGRSVWGYGASTKGSVLLQYLGCNSQIMAIADRNPLKHGTVMAGTWIPVCDELSFRRAKPDIALVLPWAFRDEFVKREHELRKAGTCMIFPLPNIEIVI